MLEDALALQGVSDFRQQMVGYGTYEQAVDTLAQAISGPGFVACGAVLRRRCVRGLARDVGDAVWFTAQPRGV